MLNYFFITVTRTDHSKFDCVLVAVLSHGDHQLLYAKDFSYKPDMLWQSFTANKCPTLAGKPKIFLIQVKFNCF
jgi:caspase-like apoptosis-related cysteine protease